MSEDIHERHFSHCEYCGQVDSDYWDTLDDYTESGEDDDTFPGWSDALDAESISLCLECEARLFPLNDEQLKALVADKDNEKEASYRSRCRVVAAILNQRAGVKVHGPTF